MPGVTTAYQAGNHAGLPAATSGAILYACSTHAKVYRSDGATWTDWLVISTGMTNPLTTTGDLIYSSSGTTAARRAIGSTGDVLTVVGGVPAWAAPAGGALAHGYAAVATQQSTSSTSYTDLATVGPAVTLTVNTKVKVTFSAETFADAACNTFVAVALSSANTVAAADTAAMRIYLVNTSQTMQLTRVLYFSGLTPGSTVFTVKYKTDASTAYWRYRAILVERLD